MQDHLTMTAGLPSNQDQQDARDYRSGHADGYDHPDQGVDPLGSDAYIEGFEDGAQERYAAGSRFDDALSADDRADIAAHFNGRLM